MSADVRLEPMTEPRYTAWEPQSRVSFAADWFATGMSAEESEAEADRQFTKLLPEGLLTEGQLFYSAFDGDHDIGFLWLQLQKESQGRSGFVYELRVNDDRRGTGYGRAIMQAGERLAVEMGMRELRLNVFGGNGPAIRLYGSLGYRPTSTQMSRRLTQTPLSGGPPVLLEPMTREQFAEYRPRAEKDYANNIARAGLLPVEEARQKAQEDFRRLLPDGLRSEGHVFLTACDGGLPVGLVWLHIEEKSDGLHAFGYDFEVSEGLRRRGYGRAIMVAAEAFARDRGVVAVGLNVFGFNEGAKSLYEQMGFEISTMQMAKSL